MTLQQLGMSKETPHFFTLFRVNVQQKQPWGTDNAIQKDIIHSVNVRNFVSLALNCLVRGKTRRMDGTPFRNINSCFSHPVQAFAFLPILTERILGLSDGSITVSSLFQYSFINATLLCSSATYRRQYAMLISLSFFSSIIWPIQSSTFVCYLILVRVHAVTGAHWVTFILSIRLLCFFYLKYVVFFSANPILTSHYRTR